MAGSWLGRDLKGCCSRPRSRFTPLDLCVSCCGVCCNCFSLSCLIFTFFFLLVFSLDPFRTDGWSQILQSPVGWSGALPCLVWLAHQTHFVFQMRIFRVYLGKTINKLAMWVCENSLFCYFQPSLWATYFRGRNRDTVHVH